MGRAHIHTSVRCIRILYNISAGVHSLPGNVREVGVLGNDSVNQKTEYAPPHSKGPGAKNYIYTVYALSAAPQLNVSADKVSREVLLTAMKDKLLATAELRVVYSRPAGSVEKAEAERSAPPPPREKSNDSNSGERQNYIFPL